MEWLPKYAELEMAVGLQKWLDMMVLYCRRSADEDREFTRQMNRLRGEMICVCEERVAFVQDLESLSGVIARAKMADFLNEAMIKDNRRIIQLHNLEREAEERAVEKDRFVHKLFHDIFVQKAISEDWRAAREINDLCARVTAIIKERESFVDELDVLAERHVPEMMAEFIRETLGKDTSNLMKLQILGREFELRAREKNLFIEKLKGNMDY
ncbi:hypothetical protein Tco_1064564 [Tanacetum coccineum]